MGFSQSTFGNAFGQLFSQQKGGRREEENLFIFSFITVEIRYALLAAGPNLGGESRSGGTMLDNEAPYY